MVIRPDYMRPLNLVLWAMVVAPLLLTACARHSLDDFPPYPPAEPFLDERALLELRLRSLSAEEARREAQHWQHRWAMAEREWRDVDKRLAENERDRRNQADLRNLSVLQAYADSEIKLREIQLRIASGELERRHREELRKRSAVGDTGDAVEEWRRIDRLSRSGEMERMYRAELRQNETNQEYADKTAVWEDLLR